MSVVALKVAAQALVFQRDDQRDRQLVRAITLHDQSALEQLYHLYRRPLLHFLARLVAGRDSIDEAINETFWVVWRQAHRFRGASQVSTWITGIAWRCALSTRRRDNGQPSHGSATPSEAAEDAALDSRVLEERSDWLDQGLSSLPVEQRATLELAYYLGHSCAEIAEIMQCPVNTVKARMFQARIKLRNLLPRLEGSDVCLPGRR